MLWGFFGNLIFAIIARMLCGNHLNLNRSHQSLSWAKPGSSLDLYLHRKLSFIDICLSLHESCVNENCQCFSFLLIWNTCLINGIAQWISTHFKPYFGLILREDFPWKLREKKKQVKSVFQEFQASKKWRACSFVLLLLGDTNDLQRRGFKLRRQCCVCVD